MLKYIAGLIDGEGCFSLSCEMQRGKVKVTPFSSISMKKGSWSSIFIVTLEEHGVKTTTRNRKGQTEVKVKGWKQVKHLIALLVNICLVKKPLMEKLLEYEPRKRKNRHMPLDLDELKRTAELIDFVRAFNKGKNRPYKWTGKKFLAAYQQTVSKT